MAEQISPLDGPIENLTVYFTSRDYLNEVNLAKREFFERSSVLDEDSPHYEMVMSQYLDYYLFSRTLLSAGIPPVDEALRLPSFPMKREDRPLYESLAASEHSLFEFVKLQNNDVYVRDLFTGFIRCLKGSGVTFGFNYDEIFDVRIFPLDGNWVFSKGFCFHPVEARKFILGMVQEHRNSDIRQREEMLLKLTRMRHKLDQYKHITFDKIYSVQSQIRI